MDERKALDTQASALMLMLCVIWSLQQIAMKAIAGSMSPMLQIALRSGVAFCLVAALMRWRRERFDWSAWRAGLLIGVLFALEYLFVALALRHTSAGHTVVFLYTSPIFAAIGLHLKLPAERLSRVQWLGIGVAFGGIAYAFLGGTGGSGQVSLWGDLLALLGGASWGATTVAIRTTRLSVTAPNQTILYQLGGAFAWLLPAAVLTGQTLFVSTPLVWASLAYQTFVMSFFSLLVWFWLLRHYLASRLGVFAFLTPVLGVVLGVLILGEPLELPFVLGSLIVLLGVLTVTLHTAVADVFRRLTGAAA
ncbi:EamA family transporter [Rhodoferax lacus]|uniref:EamA family transporter n=1 Tax=Rhodoferax lacus TaxID=2184758 RepID=A0A3E1RCV3_9BURK|nr:DMT family transporter [Rhodoferax lacus]RFO97103.1 EamA family transporter [Rhodoferax lacus]